MKEQSLDLLARARQVYEQAELSYRECMLKTGQLLHEFILAKLSERGTAPPPRRSRHTWSREECIKLAASELGCDTDRVNVMIQTAMAFVLLGEGADPGALPFGVLMAFGVFVERRKQWGEGCERPDRLAGSSAEEYETWQIKPGMEERGKGLLRRAIAECWVQTKAYAECRPGTKPTGVHQSRKRAKASKEDLQCRMPTPPLAQMAAHASVGDVADMCLELIRAAEDPRAVAEKLLPELQRIKQTTKRPSLAEVLSD
jgi:hypothetical protein